MMESSDYPSSRNGDSKLVEYMPEFKITYLTKVRDPSLIKSPSWPSSPVALRPEPQASQGAAPSPFSTLGRPAYAKKVSDDEFGIVPDAVHAKRSSDPQLEEIRSMLSSLDLSRYMRKPKLSLGDLKKPSQALVQRSLSIHPHLGSGAYANGKKSFLDDIPPPPKTQSMLGEWNTSGLEKAQRKYSLELTPVKRASRPVNSKLKELTEKLRPSSAPPSPHRRQKASTPSTAPPLTEFNFWKDAVPEAAETPAPKSEDTGKDAEMEDSREIPDSEPTKPSTVTRALSTKHYATLPRVKARSHSKSKSLETRTLASLDLNATLDSLIGCSGVDGLKGFSDERGVVSARRDAKENESDAPKSSRSGRTMRSPLQRQEELENNADLVLGLPRKNNVKSSAKKKDEFDLHFVKYGSLSPPKDKKEERRKSLPKIESYQSLHPAKLCKKNASRSEESYSSNDENAESFDKTQNEDSFEEHDTSTANLRHTDAKPSEKSDAEPKDSTKEDQSAPANTLEEEIRTIAKLLDGKESLFMKLIQSSKAPRPEAQVSDSPRSFSPPSVAEDQSAPSSRSAGRSSPSRTRAMTVPNTENTRTASPLPSMVSPPQQKRYFKKRLRGPYGEMLEQEMSKSLNKTRPSYAKDLDFLKELETPDPKDGAKQSPDRLSAKPRPLLRSTSHSFDESHSIAVDGAPKRKTSANIPILGAGGAEDGLCVPTTAVSGTVSEPILHIRSHSDSVKTSSAWNVDSILSGILKQPTQQDTRTHIVGELYETELSYVESLQIIVKKYMLPLKSSEHSAEIEAAQVDGIFWKVPEILLFHEGFLNTLKTRLVYWDTKQKIGDVFVDVFTRPPVVDTYIEFINNWKLARDTIKSVSLAKPAFAKFLENTSREHKGKLTLDALLIMPVQRIPRYELLIKELLKHTPMDHPDYKLLLQAQKEVHDLAIKINKVEREALQQEQMLQKLREVEHLIEGAVDLIQGDRAFIRNDFVLIPGGLGLKKERCLFLFSDILLISSVKKKSGAMRKTSLAVNSSTCGSLESNKYKLLMRTSLHNVDIVKKIDEPCVTKFMKEISTLENDILTVGKMIDLMGNLSFQNSCLDDTLREILSNLNKQLTEKQVSSSQMMSLDLSITIDDETRNLTFIFPNPEQRMTWEIAFSEAKEKLGKSFEKYCPPEFLCSLPLRKTRAGLQITCAAAVADACQSGLPDLWICSSDGYVGQVSVLAFQNEPVITSCVNVSSSRILCIAAVPGMHSGSLFMRRRSTLLSYLPGFKYERLGKEHDFSKEKQFPLDSDSDDDFIDATEEDFPFDDPNLHQSTMWLGTEDGWIYVYNCADTKLRKAKLKIQHSSCIYDILHVDGQVFVSLANGELAVYSRDPNGIWNTGDPQIVHVATDVSPISKMMLIKENIWCSTLNSIVIINTSSLEIEHTFHVVSDLNRHITSIVPCNLGVWMAIQSSPVIHLYDVTSYEHLLEVNISMPVTKMLSGCDDIIRQHKLACLRVSSLCVEKDLLWIGTSAGVILNLSLSSICTFSGCAEVQSHIEGLLQGHSGHVRFLTSICASSGKDSFSSDGSSIHSAGARYLGATASTSSASPYSAVVISGGDGYEDFGSLDDTETTGRDDSTNHLLMWRV